MDQQFRDGAAYADWRMSTSNFLEQPHFLAKLRLTSFKAMSIWLTQLSIIICVVTESGTHVSRRGNT
jgi:hypothetical protein